MVHLLGASSVVGLLTGSGDRAHILKGVNASILDQTLAHGLVLCKLVHNHLLVHLLGGEHI